MFARKFQHMSQRASSSIIGGYIATVNSNSNNNNNYTAAADITVQTRSLNIQEYKAKELMQRFGVAHQRGLVIDRAEDAREAALRVRSEFDSENIIVKSQILAGGRGKGVFDTGYKGGVKFCTSPEKVEEVSREMLGHRLSTIQTPPEGILVRKLFVAECLDFKREMYFAILLDRASDGAVIIASTEGGVDIEEVAARDPQAIAKCVIADLDAGVSEQQMQYLCKKLGLAAGSEQEAQARELVGRLYELFLRTDATQLEVNPLVETDDGRIACIDAKINFDDNAHFRQQEIFSWRDFDEEDPREVEASRHDLNYVGLDGDIGCMVNGAGLAMATMDVLNLYGGSPANFLDVGGSADQAQISAAFKLLQSDPNVKAILVNIFGGIMRCNVIAEGIVGAAKEIGLRVPLVVRLSGTNRDLGMKILQESGIDCITAENLDDAARRAVDTTTAATAKKEN